MLLSLDDFCAFSSARSDGDRLKKAISEPLANADIAISIIVSKMQIITPVVGATRYTSESESEINFKYVSTIVMYI